METKICKKCGRELPINDFRKNRCSCKQCEREYFEKHRTEHKKERNEYSKKWKSEHKDYITQYGKQYWEQYCSTLRGYCITVRNNNIKEDRKYGRIGEELPNNYPTVEDYMKLLQLPDFYDGEQYDFNEMGLDRIDNTKPHTFDNVVSCTTKHNKQRHTIPFEVFCAKFNKMEQTQSI